MEDDGILMLCLTGNETRRYGSRRFWKATAFVFVTCVVTRHRGSIGRDGDQEDDGKICFERYQQRGTQINTLEIVPHFSDQFVDK